MSAVCSHESLMDTPIGQNNNESDTDSDSVLKI